MTLTVRMSLMIAVVFSRNSVFRLGIDGLGCLLHAHQLDFYQI